MARTPADWVNCTAAVPTPLPTAWIRTVSPSERFIWRKRASKAVMKTSGIAPASSVPTPAGTRTAVRSWATTNSAYPPPPTIPMTRSPFFQRVTSGPTASTVPEYSRPGMSSGEPGGAGYFPTRCRRSARFNPDALTRTRICLSPGWGRSTSWTLRTSGPPNSVMTTARMDSAMSASLGSFVPVRVFKM